MIDQNVDIAKQLQCELRIRFYPRDIADDVIEAAARHRFYLQVKHEILAGEICVPPAAALQLAAIALQEQHGNYKENLVAGDRLLPQRVINQHQMPEDERRQSIASGWQQLKDMRPEDAQLAYVKMAQGLPMFGANYFKIRVSAATGVELRLGVDELGVSIYRRDDNKLVPIIDWLRTEIREIFFECGQFSVANCNRCEPDVVFGAADERDAKRIRALLSNYYKACVRCRQSSAGNAEGSTRAAVCDEEQANATQRKRDKCQATVVARDYEAKKWYASVCRSLADEQGVWISRMRKLNVASAGR